MKVHIRSVIANPHTGTYCHWFMVDETSFKQAVKGLAIPRFTQAGVDMSALYLKACDTGGYEGAALHLMDADKYYLLEYSNQAKVA